MKLVKTIDNLLNKLTMYRLLVYGLGALLGAAIILAFFHQLPLDWVALSLSATVILTAAFIADRAWPVLFNATSNKDSSLITALILCCILPPSTRPHNLALLALGGLLAVSSKYLLAVKHKHMFNPAALAAFVLGISNLLPAIWWIGSPAMLPLTLVFGTLVLRKVRRFQMFWAFLGASILIAIVVGLHNGASISYILTTAFRSSPLIFLGSVMLTEPSTTPPRLRQQYIYGAIVGGIFTSQLHLGSTISATPELALLIGNVFAYLVSPKYKLQLTFQRRTQLSPQIYEFAFSGASQLNFRPGQYLEWTMPVSKTDSRGNRRTFSIASAPQEDELHIAIRVPDESSVFKSDLMQLKPGQPITAGQLAGDFVLPDNPKQKVALVAGGIGITPFVSMAKAMIKHKETRDLTLFYLVGNPQDYCYRELWAAATKFGLRVIPVLTDDKQPAPANWPGLTGRLTEATIQKQLPDYAQRKYYISGPPGLVVGYRQLLRGLGISQKDIITDYFSGY